MFCVAKIPPKVVRKMVEIRYFVGFRTNLQLIVLKILSGVSCDEKRFLYVCEIINRVNVFVRLKMQLGDQRAFCTFPLHRYFGYNHSRF